MTKTDTNNRPSKHDYYLQLALDVAKRGTCIRRNFGAIIVKNDEIIATGYTGAPRGSINCCDKGTCQRQDLNIPSGQRYELCRSVHAEMNAIISAPRNEMNGATMYLAGWEMVNNTYDHPVNKAEPCLLCKRMIVNAGILEVISCNYDTDAKSKYFFQSSGLWLAADII